MFPGAGQLVCKGGGGGTWKFKVEVRLLGGPGACPPGKMVCPKKQNGAIWCYLSFEIAAELSDQMPE